MIGLKKRDIKKALKAGAKAGGMSLADVRELQLIVILGIFLMFQSFTPL